MKKIYMFCIALSFFTVLGCNETPSQQGEEQLDVEQEKPTGQLYEGKINGISCIVSAEKRIKDGDELYLLIYDLSDDNKKAIAFESGENINHWLGYVDVIYIMDTLDYNPTYAKIETANKATLETSLSSNKNYHILDEYNDCFFWLGKLRSISQLKQAEFLKISIRKGMSNTYDEIEIPAELCKYLQYL